MTDMAWFAKKFGPATTLGSLLSRYRCRWCGGRTVKFTIAVLTAVPAPAKKSPAANVIPFPTLATSLAGLGQNNTFTSLNTFTQTVSITNLDITATLESRQALARTISAVAKQIFLPLTVGGGIRTEDDAAAAVDAGADKGRDRKSTRLNSSHT